MINKLRAGARAVALRFPIIVGLRDIARTNMQKIREYKNIGSLLSELHSDTALQLPLLVEQNRKMLREVESLKMEINLLKTEIRKFRS